MAAKSIDDLPHFAVTSVESGEKHPATGYLEFKLNGTFDHLTGVCEGSGWLLLPERDWLAGALEALDPHARTAIFSTFEESAADLADKRLPYVDGYWRAYHVWMVTEPSRGWERTLLQRREAVAEIVDGGEPQTVEGQEVRRWIRVRETGEGSGKERWYPVLSGDLQPQINVVTAGGWDHEHCELCGASIDVGDYGFVDADEHWVCESCYAKYVATHDLSFMLLET